MKLARGSFQEIESAAILRRVVFHNANREARAEISGVTGIRDSESGIGAHGLEAREFDRLECGAIQEMSVRLGDRLGSVFGGPVIGVFGRAELRAAGVAVGIECGEGTVDDDERDAAEMFRQHDENLFGDLKFSGAKDAAAVAEAVSGPDDEIEAGALPGIEGALLKADARGGDTIFEKAAKGVGVVNFLFDFITFVDEIEIHPLRASGLERDAVVRHDGFE